MLMRGKKTVCKLCKKESISTVEQIIFPIAVYFAMLNATNSIIMKENKGAVYVVSF